MRPASVGGLDRRDCSGSRVVGHGGRQVCGASMKGRMKQRVSHKKRWLGAPRGLPVVLAVAGLVLAAALLAAQPAWAVSPSQLVQQPGVVAEPTQPIDVVVVLDDSGSMATCWPWPREGLPFSPPCGFPSENPPSDPDVLRYSAARLLLQLADDDDRLAVVRFDSVAEGIGALAGLVRVGDGANRSQLAATIQPPTDYLPRGYTRIDLGLELAIQLLQAGREPGRTQYVLLLTDGEPTEPGNALGQKERITAQLATLHSEGVLVFPVVLCNSEAGCSGEFLAEQFGEGGINEAKTAQELLTVFSDIVTRMKPDRSLIATRNPAGSLQFTTRPEHGVQSVAVVTPRNGLLGLRRDDAPVLTSNALNDPNIDLNVLTSESLAAGAWVADTADASGFVVVQAASYPQLINPPPSLADSPASVRYYPAGKSPLLLARANGPGASEPLLLNGETTMPVFGQDNLRALILADEPASVRLQLGADVMPLQLARSFRLEARPDLPRAEAIWPQPGNPGLLADGRARLQVAFSGGANVTDLAATAYVLESSTNGDQPLAYQANLTCDGQSCTDENFHPVDGRSYEVTFVLQGQLDGVRFSDWAKTELALAPAVYLRGLPAELDLSTMPADGWPVELGSGTLEEIGALTAALVLRSVATGEEMTGVALDFVKDVPEEGVTATTLHIDGLDTLRPGDYEGEIVLSATSPAGLPMDVNIRPGALLPVTLSVPRPLAQLDTQAVDFGEVLFDTSPNFRLDHENLVPLVFAGKPFPVSATLVESSCANVTVVTGEVVERDGRWLLPVRLSSAGPVLPTTCTGAVALGGPNDDYDVRPAQLAFQSRVASVEWSIVSGDLHLPDFQDAGGRVATTVLVRFNGKTPFVIQAEELQGAGSVAGADASAAPVNLTAEAVDIPVVEISGPPNEAGLYEVPLTLIARQTIPGDRLRGTFYSGQIKLSIAGLPGDTQSVNFSFRSPSLYQRYVAPIVVPVYSLPWVLCTGPLTLLIVLVVVARVRGRGFDETEVEQAAAAAAMQLSPPSNVNAPPLPLPSAIAARSEVAWGSSEWGGAWGPGGAQGGPGEPLPGATVQGTHTAYPNGAGPKPTVDPWTNSW